MRDRYEWFGVYGPDVAALGVVVILAGVVASTFAFVSAMQAAGGVVGWVALRVLPQVQDRVQTVVRDAAAGLARTLIRPATVWLTRTPLVYVLKGAAFILGGGALLWIAYVLWRTSDSHAAMLAGSALAAVGLTGHYIWFRTRVAYWTRANT